MSIETAMSTTRAPAERNVSGSGARVRFAPLERGGVSLDWRSINIPSVRDEGTAYFAALRRIQSPGKLVVDPLSLARVACGEAAGTI